MRTAFQRLLIVVLLVALPGTVAAQLEGFGELRDGQKIANYLRSLAPTGDSSWKGELVVRHPDRTTDRYAIRSSVRSGTESWNVTYEVKGEDGRPLESLTIVRRPDGSNSYQFTRGSAEPQCLSGSRADIPLAGSEFLLTDLGLEFLSWPNQDRPRGELRRGQSCHVLESRPADDAAGAYSKIVSWIDKDTGGVLEAEAYGPDGRRLKEFSVGRFKKVDGVWHLQEMEMRNRQTGARTRIEFEIERNQN